MLDGLRWANKKTFAHPTRLFNIETTEPLEIKLFDPNAISYEDEDAKGEQRHLSIGLDSLGRVLVVVYTYHADNIRLISARPATRKERQNYDESRI